MAKNERRIALDEIILDPRLQARARLSDDLVGDYARAMEDGSKFPPLELWKVTKADSSVDSPLGLYLVDGFHRLGALRATDAKFFKARCVGEGALEDAQLYALGVNSRNGQRMTNADKNRVVKLALVHPGLKEASARDIGRACGVSHAMVAQVRKMLETVPKEVSDRITEDEQRANPLAPEPKPEAPMRSEAPPEEPEPEAPEPGEFGDDEFEEAIGILRTASRGVGSTLKDHRTTRERVAQLLRQAVAEIERVRPVPCPECGGEKGCPFCGFSGQVQKHVAGKARGAQRKRI